MIYIKLKLGAKRRYGRIYQRNTIILLPTWSWTPATRNLGQGYRGANWLSQKCKLQVFFLVHYIDTRIK
jgi:hypothetical protein